MIAVVKEPDCERTNLTVRSDLSPNTSAPNIKPSINKVQFEDQAEDQPLDEENIENFLNIIVSL